MVLVVSGSPDAFERSEKRHGGKIGGAEKAVSGRERPGFSESKQAAHDDCEIVTGHCHEISLLDVVQTSKPCAA